MGKFDGVLNNGKDFDMSKICSCSSHSMDWCEKNCRKYYSCDSITMADDILKEYEDKNESVGLATRIYDCLSDGYDDEEYREESENALYDELSQLDNDSYIKVNLIALCERIEELEG